MRIARLVRGLTRKELDRRLWLPAGTIRAYERCDVDPDPRMVRRLARVLDFPGAFFEWDRDNELEPFDPAVPSPCGARRLSGLTAVATIVAQWIVEQCDDVPAIDVEPLRGCTRWGLIDDPTFVGELLRIEWGLRYDAIIANVLNLLEARGVFVFALPPALGVPPPGAAFWADGRPALLLAIDPRYPEWTRFNAMRLLGDLVLEDTRRASFAFAMGFFVPRSQCLAQHAGQGGTHLLREASALGIPWRALAHHLHHLNLLSRRELLDLLQRYHLDPPHLPPTAFEISQVLTVAFSQDKPPQAAQQMGLPAGMVADLVHPLLYPPAAPHPLLLPQWKVRTQMARRQSMRSKPSDV